MTVKARGRETGGSFSQIELNDPRGTATPWHVHRAVAETFHVLEGERIDLVAGELAFAPVGIAHAYIVRSEQARTPVTISPAGLEDVFVELGEPITGREAPAGDVLPPPDVVVSVSRVGRGR